MDKVKAIIDRIIATEGREFTNDPADSGGPTKFGITQAALARWRRRPVTPAEVETMTVTEARAIYRHRFVNEPGSDEVLKISPEIGEELIDTGVNTGPAVATIMLQRSLNALNRQERDYPDIKVDGACGPRTVGALRRYLEVRESDGGETVLLRALNALQGAHYISLAERRSKDEKFLFGWLKNRMA